MFDKSAIKRPQIYTKIFYNYTIITKVFSMNSTKRLYATTNGGTPWEGRKSPLFSPLGPGPAYSRTTQRYCGITSTASTDRTGPRERSGMTSSGGAAGRGPQRQDRRQHRPQKHMESQSHKS